MSRAILESFVRIFSPQIRDGCVSHPLHITHMRRLRSLPSRIGNKNLSVKTSENCSKISLLCFFILLAQGATSAPKPPVKEEGLTFKIVTSRTHHLYYLLECLVGEAHRSPEMAATFTARVGNWTPVESALKSWKTSLRSDELGSLRLPPRGDRSPKLGDILERVAIDSKGADDMIGRVSPWLGPHHSARLAEALLVLEPLHRAYWWDPALRDFQERRRQLEGQLESGQFVQALQQAGKFFEASPSNGDPLVLALLPYQKGIGETKSRTRGHSQGGLQVLEVVVDKADSDSAGTVFHEFMHFLWSQQTPQERDRWREAFEKHGLIGKVAYHQLNEGLATALGNGWFSSRVWGDPDSGSWYADSVIDAFGKALYPIVKPAIEQGRPPTDLELNRMVEAFQRVLPNALSRFDVVAADFSVTSSRPEIQRGAFQNEVMKLGPVRWSRTRTWDQEPEQNSTFQIYLLEESERSLLTKRGWSKDESQGFKKYRLLQKESGWQLAFLGESDELFVLLRRLNEKGLAPAGE